MVRAAGLVMVLVMGRENPDPNPKARPKHGVQKRQHVVKLSTLNRNKLKMANRSHGLG
jgi:hypothetical protein